MKIAGSYKWYLKSLFFVMLMAFTAAGCKKASICDCFKGTGKLTTESRTATPFYEVDLYNKTDLHVHHDSIYRISVTAGEKLIDNLTTEINNGVLKIENKNKCNWVRNFDNTFSVDIYTPSLKTIEVNNSSGNIYFNDTLFSDQFLFESWGSTGDYHLKLNCGTVTLALQTGPASLFAEGRTSVGYLWNSGGGRFNALNLYADDIYSTNMGTNDVLLYSGIRLEAIIEFSGNIYYKGNPSKQQLQDNGSGKFISL